MFELLGPWLRLGCVVFACCLGIGCSKSEEQIPTFPATGSITFQGRPMPGAFVSLHPQSASKHADGSVAPTPRASLRPDGTFALTTYTEADGAPEGEYVLTVKWYRPIKKNGEFISGPNVLPRKYEQPQTSDIKIRIAAQENQIPPIQLK